MTGDEWTDESFYDDNEAYQKQRGDEKAPLMGTPTDPVIPWGTLPVPDEGLKDAAAGYPSRRTVPEALDAAKDGKEFMQVIQGLFKGLEVAMDAEEEDDE